MHVVFDASDLKENVHPENARPNGLKTALFELYLKTPSAEYISPEGRRELWKSKQSQLLNSDGERLAEVKDYFSKNVTECFRMGVTLGEVRTILMQIAKFIDSI